FFDFFPRPPRACHERAGARVRRIKNMKPGLRPYTDYTILALLAVLSYAIFFHGLGGIGCVGPDEPRYASIAREMLTTGDYITPRLYGIPWFEKPVFMYWLSPIGVKILGGDERGRRF